MRPLRFRSVSRHGQGMVADAHLRPHQSLDRLQVWTLGLIAE